jgi:glutamyl-tRNA reductase
LNQEFPDSESVLISTCNRVEVYTASDIDTGCPTHHDLVTFLADFHELSPMDVSTSWLSGRGRRGAALVHGGFQLGQHGGG